MCRMRRISRIDSIAIVGILPLWSTMSFTTIQVPSTYGFVLATSIVLQFMTSMYMGGKVMEARKKFNVPYPNLYATPGYHKDADAFNRVQRGHQSYYETFGVFTLAALVGGLKYPLISLACIFMFNIGCCLYQVGYADVTLPVETARYKRGGQIKWIGLLTAIGTAVVASGSFAGLW
jgi:glutathione S-transferase